LFREGIEIEGLVPILWIGLLYDRLFLLLVHHYARTPKKCFIPLLVCEEKETREKSRVGVVLSS
jgi:hypothetical protein